MPPPKPPKQKFPKQENPEAAKAMINRERHRSAGASFQSTVVGSGLKTSTGA
jgi:hypothetical protein